MIIVDKEYTKIVNFDNVTEINKFENENMAFINVYYINSPERTIATFTGSDKYKAKKFMKELATNYRGSATLILPD